MAGKKQHYIPQFLLKGFCRVGSGKKAQVVVFNQSRHTFAAATDGIGAARYFYSVLNVGGDEPTLDDKITDYETELMATVEALRAADFGESLSIPGIAELVVHLGIRNANARSAITFAASEMFTLVADTFDTSSKVRSLLGLNSSTPSEVMGQALDNQLDRLPEWMSRRLGTRSQAKNWAYEQLQDKFDDLFEGERTAIRGAFDYLVEGLDDVATNSHRKVLEETMAPEARVAALSEFRWTCELQAGESLVLPDCVVAAREGEGAFLPIFLTDKDKIEHIILPLSPSRILVGSRSDGRIDLERINESIVGCSWDFFVGSDFLAAHKRLIPFMRASIEAAARQQTMTAWEESQE